MTQGNGILAKLKVDHVLKARKSESTEEDYDVAQEHNQGSEEYYGDDTKNSNITTFYHGTSRLYFSHFNASFNGVSLKISLTVRPNC